MTPYKTVLLFGAPGSGKGTQGKILNAKPGFRHVACGDVFRSLDRTSPIGLEFAKYASGGGLVPDQLTVELWRTTMQSMVQDGRYDPARQVLLLDGIPRTVEQAQLMANMIDVAAIVHLYVNDATQIVQRLQARALKENRKDDADIEVIRYRIDVYEEQTRPVLEFYPFNKIFRVNATQEPEKVTGDILKALAVLELPITGDKFE
jgi:adenylate kinase